MVAIILPLAIVFGPAAIVLVIGTLIQFVRILESDDDET